MQETKMQFTTTEKIRIDEFLRREMPAAVGENCSNSKIRRLIVAGAVLVNGRVVNRPAFELRGRSQVCVDFDKEKFFFEKQPDDIQFEVTESDVLFEDENLIFINKPAFFPVEQTITQNRDNLHDAVVRYLWSKNPGLRNPPYVGIMHRLDRETSGVILFTKNRSINKAVSEMFQTHNFTKKYVAVVSGKNLKAGERFTVEKYMGRVTGKSQAGKWGCVSEAKGGQYSKTDFFVIGEKTIEGKKFYEIECTLFTGRTHQIRVHLAEEGLPILGDKLYGGGDAKRMYLHACELSVNNSDLCFNVKSNPNW